MAGLIGLVGLASDGPGFLAPQRTIDVVFRDAQGIRIGSPVRVAGLDTGNVVDVDLVEVEGDAPRQGADLAAGHPGQEAAPGREGLDPAGADRHEPRQRRLDGPVERGARARAVDPGRRDVVLRPDHRAGRPGPRSSATTSATRSPRSARRSIRSGPRLRQILGSLQETTTNLREMSDSIRPAVESTVGQVEDLTKRNRPTRRGSRRSSSASRSMTGEVQGIWPITARTSGRRWPRSAT